MGVGAVGAVGEVEGNQVIIKTRYKVINTRYNVINTRFKSIKIRYKI